VAIVDAYDDPTVRADLNTFDAQYHIPAETATSLQIVNQKGGSKRPPANASWAGEITLDVQAARALCRRCKILLVEASSSSDSDLAVAADEAVAFGADIVSNSYGSPDTDPGNTAAVRAAYNHPGVAMIASSGDDGWYGWDVLNEGLQPPNVPNVPASLSTVIGVGGTSLYLNPDNSRASEIAWNNNGPSDVYGANIGTALGATGSGCSNVTAPRWQQSIASYGGLGCGTRRSEVDIAAVGDPFTGLDIFRTYPAATGSWVTAGGTSLSAPLVAAMWALAGGPQGVRYPGLSLYGHFTSDAVRPTYDVTVGGTGLCGTATPAACITHIGRNPNTLAAGPLDCDWDAKGALLANRYQCNARPGYDGVSGVGTPIGATVFTPESPTAAITKQSPISRNHAAWFSAQKSTDPFPGGFIATWTWNWGDGRTSQPSTASTTHTYTRAGTYRVTLTVSDNYGRHGTRAITVTVA
jgi:hypothetical protein